MAHTPGPWTPGKKGNWKVFGPQDGAGNSGLIAEVRKCRANVDLIAAAPDLLEACEALIASVTQETPRGNIYALGELHSAVDAARAAVAKAQPATAALAALRELIDAPAK